METVLTLAIVLILALFLALVGAGWLLWNGTRNAIDYLTRQLEAREHRIAELEGQIDSQHAQGIPAATLADRESGPELPPPLPKEIEASIEDEIEDEAAREDFRERARYYLAEKPGASNEEVLADLYTS